MKPSPVAGSTFVVLVCTIFLLSESVGRADQPCSLVKHRPVWEYKTANCGHHSGLPDELNELGEEGWELVQIADGIGVFKRMKTAPNETIRSSVHIELVDDLGVIELRGKEKDVKRVTDWMRQNEQQRGASASSVKDDQETGKSMQAVQLVVYSLGVLDARTVLSLLQELLAGRPDVRFDADLKTRRLIVLARPNEHAMIREILEKMRPHSVVAKPVHPGGESHQEKKREDIGDGLARRLIYLRHSKAAEVAQVIREVYQRKRTGMSVGKISRLNAIVLVTSDTLFWEVKELAEALDRASTEPNQTILKMPAPQLHFDGVEEGMKASELEHRQRFLQLLEGQETSPPRKSETSNH